MIRPTRPRVGRALADRLRRHRAMPDDFLATTPLVRPISRATRLRRLLAASRVTPYQLRRGWLW